jgi:DNA replication and repair protein RecF
VIGVEISKDRNEIRVAGQRAKGFAAVAHLLPVRVIDPEVHRLLEDGSRLRRRFLDWGVFHVEPRFVEAWRRYQAALQQRNAAIKSKASKKEVASWDRELLESGAFVAQARKHYLDEIDPFVAPITQTLLGTAVELRNRQGWTESQTFEEALAAAWQRDQRYGVTTVGPHRADFVAMADGVPAKQRVSRGQQKLLVAALMLAQLRHRHRDSDERALLLLDDPAAELDVDNLGKLMEQVSQTPAQLIVTSTQETSLELFRPRKKFHVKHGQIDTLQ